MSFIDKSPADLKKFGEKKSEEYASADPFPNIMFDNFFIPEKLKEVLEEFPDLSKKPDIKFNDENQIKRASRGEGRFGEKTKHFMHYMNSEPFLDFLSALTGIENLIPDPYFEGGGCHQILPGGKLGIHADFNVHPRTKLDRRLNVLVYMNEDWDESYGGHFELWDIEMKGAVKRILPLFNRMAIFSTTSTSYHGHPNPLTCPPDRTRKSLALYYYTNGRPEEEVNEAHLTLFRERPEDKGKPRYKKPSKLKKALRAITPSFLRKKKR